MSKAAQKTSLRPKMVTVFVAAFLAGGTAAFGVNLFIEVTRTRSKATVECEPIFVALRDVPAGNPVTVMDVKLLEWPKAMVPQAALRPGSFDGVAWPDGHVARLSLRVGQPVLRSHLQSAVVEVQPSVPQPVAVAAVEPVASSRPEPVADTAVVAQAPSAAESPAATESPLDEPRQQPAGTALSVAEAISAESQTVESQTVESQTADSKPTESPTTDSEAAESRTTVAASPTPAEAVTGEGWPNAAETAAGSEAAMRFLVVPERIAIMADELTSPRKPETPSTPVATVATQPKQTVQPKQPVQAKQQATPKQTTTNQTMPKAKYPDQRAKPTMQSGRGSEPPRQPMQQQTRSTPAPSAVRRQPTEASPAANGRPASAPTPRVTVEPDPESELADDDARSATLKSVFPNVTAGLEKIESEVSRFRRERLGRLFRAADSPTTEGGDEHRTAPSFPWLPSFR